MKRNCTGEYFITATPGEKVKAFIPLPLPPKPPIHINAKLLALLEKASLTIGKLDSLSINMPDSSIILYQYIRKEAVLSSQIEGTQSSLSDLLKFENDELPGVPLDDVQEVSNYVAAINYGLKRIQSDNFPVSIRLLKEIHKILLSQRSILFLTAMAGPGVCLSRFIYAVKKLFTNRFYISVYI
jgi:Fic family protein